MSNYSLYVQLPDDHLLVDIFGEHDRHLLLIEEKFKVSISCRGSTVAISGEKEPVIHAKKVIETLSQRAQTHKELSIDDVESTIRMIQTTPKDEAIELLDHDEDNVVIKTQKRFIRPFSYKQKGYLHALQTKDLVICEGPAGTGKTYLAVAVAVFMYLNNKVDRIILSRPAVEAGEKLGFLPGDMKEKVDPYLRPLYDAMHDMLPSQNINKLIEGNIIEIAPLAFMRGRTLKNAYIILDEAQNATPAQIKMFITRLGEGSRMSITGDLTQTDLPASMRSGLEEALLILKNVEGIDIHHFTDEDVVRHPLTARIIKAYQAYEEKRKKSK